MSVKLEWKNKKTLTSDEYLKATQVYKFIRECNEDLGTHPTANRIATYFGATAPEIRKDIQNIRENYELFGTGNFLVAGKKGYYITKDKKVINSFIKKTHLMAQHKLQQVEQGYKALGKKGW